MRGLYIMRARAVVIIIIVCDARHLFVYIDDDYDVEIPVYVPKLQTS